MLEYEHLSPATQKKVDGLVAANGWTFEQAMEEIVIEGIAMGGLTSAGRPKAKLVDINGPPKGLGQIRAKKDPN
ncbi:hypothetical protein NUH87_26665 [Pseudomonas batumici]|uniref:hypothetical protein n=1 Tax=Pseudomonas batumici TaxID=226910 RepID=UPI0030CFBDF6